MLTNVGPRLSFKAKFISIFLPSLFIVSTIYFFGPFTIYQGNVDDFGFSLRPILSLYVVPALILGGGLWVIGVLLPGRGHKLFVVATLTIGILLWLQGNIFVWDYGVFGKGQVDWSANQSNGVIELVVWSTLLVVALIFFKRIYPLTRSASLLFIALQAIGMIFTSYQNPGTWSDRTTTSRPTSDFFSFSKKQNVIHVILDELQADVFQKIIDSDPEHYGKVFEGFTFFKENAGSFPTTIMSVPAFLSGQVYDTDIPIQKFVDSIYETKTIPNVLFEKGFDVDLAAEQAWYSYGKYTNWFYTPVPYGVAAGTYEQANADYISKLTIFRHIPHFLKQQYFQEGVSMALIDMGEKRNYEALRHFSHEAFLQDLIDSMSVTREKPLYKLVHLTTTHWPTVVDSNCEYAGDILPFTWENILVQAKCSVDHFVQFIDKLKALGIYDSALIIVNADHGYWKIPDSKDFLSFTNVDKDLGKDFKDIEDFAEKASASAPLLAIKLPHSTGGLKTSRVLSSNTDLPATVNSLLHLGEIFPGKSVFDLDTNEVRPRHYYYYTDLNKRGDKYFHRIDEYIIRGNLRDRASWEFVSLHLPPGVLGSTKKIILGTDAASRFLRNGWSFREVSPDKDGMTYSWAIGKSASIYMALPKTGLKMTANFRCPFEKGQQTVSVKVDGKDAGSWKNSKQWEWEKQSVTIQADPNRPALSEIEFMFSKTKPPDAKDYRELALLFESIAIEDSDGK